MLKDRVEQRLKALGLNQFEAVEGSELSRHFIYDILAGRKHSIRGKNAITLARILQCSVAFLDGTSDSVGDPPIDLPSGPAAKNLPAVGVIDSQQWRNENADPVQTFPMSPLPNYAASRQFLFLSLEDATDQIRNGMVVVAVAAEDYARNHGLIGPGTTVIIRRRRHIDGKTYVQTLVRKLANTAEDRALAKRLDGDRSSAPAADNECIIAVPVLAAHQM